MQCSSPVRIRDPHDSKNYIYVRCGNCTACRIEYQNEWKIRGLMELKKYDYSMWCALTYDEVHLSLQNLEYEEDTKFSYLGRIGRKNSLEKEELKLFWKRFRKALKPLKVRYMQCGEYGDEFGRPHYHCIIFGLSPDHPIFKGFKYVAKRKGYVGYLPQWPHGEFWFAPHPANEENIAYLAKYIHKLFKGKNKERHYNEQNLNPEFFSVSNRPGIGSDIIDANVDYFIANPYFQIGKRKMGLPRYVVERVNEKNGDFKEIYKGYHFEHMPVKSFDGKQQERNLKHVIKD